MDIFNKLPKVESEGYYLRLIGMDDLYDIYEKDKEEELHRYNNSIPMNNLDDARNYIELVQRAKKNNWFLRMGLVDKSIDKLIGVIAFHHIEVKNKAISLGYSLNTSYFHKGIMTKILRKVVEVLFERGYKRVELTIHPQNIKSIALAKRLGFEYEGCKRCCVYNESLGQFEDRYIYSVLNENN